MTARLDRWQSKSWQIGQCALAAGIAWFIAADVLGHQAPFFAPIAAVVSLGTTYGQRLRRVAEVTVGVAVGVFLADLIVAAIGSGWWQLAIIVALAMSTAILLDGGQLFMMQAAVQSIVVAALVANPGAALTRWTDALIGGAVALVAATVVPAAPLRRPREQAARVVRKVAELLRAAADVMVDGVVDRALALLADARSTDHLITELRAAADEGLRWWRPHPSGSATRAACAGWSISSTRSTARCAAPACWSGGPRSPPTGTAKCPGRTPCCAATSATLPMRSPTS